MIVERKEKPDGRVQEFACRAVHIGRGFALIAFEMPDGAAGFDVPVTVPRGALSLGFFWRSRPYSLYRLLAPGGEVIAHRFDAVAGVRITEAAVSYRDLVLDWWALPDGTLLEEDRDELDELVRDGVVSAGDAARAEKAALAVTSRYRHIIEEAGDLAARYTTR